ncbi:MAG: transketolase [Candidatus Omnitrophica bacterium]|nr:transketolase [Candidatus Omnitrophota bacterium]
MRNTFVDVVIRRAQERRDIFVVSGDAGLGVFDSYRTSLPEQFLNLGVAEQNMASFSAGLALSGYKVYMYNIIPFLLYRCYEQVRNDICYQNLPVVLAGIGSGVTYAPQGMTHYSVEDIGLARTLPNLFVFSPIDPVEARAAALFSLEASSPVYVRLAKRGEPCIHGGEQDIRIDRPQLIRKGGRLAILVHGSLGPEALAACELLNARGLEPMLISVPLIQPLPVDELFALLEGCEHVVSVEEHFVGCGLGSILAKAHSLREPSWKLHPLGIQDAFIHEIKDTQGMREYFGISAARIAAFIEALL